MIVATIDGVEHLVHFTKDLVVHGGKGTGVEALQALREGNTVVVHYVVEGNEATAQEIDCIGDDGLKGTEGVVTRIDRRRKQITVRFEGGRIQTFRLTEHATADAGKEIDQTATAGTKITVYYSDEAGHKVAHFFKKTS